MEIKQEPTKKTQRDNALIREALENNNQQAYAELMENYRESLYLMILKMVNNPYDAEDLMIESFGKAFHHLHTYTNKNAFSTWLFKIAANNCIDFLRKKRLNMVMLDYNYENEEGEIFTFEVKDQTLDPEERYCDNENKKMMKTVVGRLKPHYRTLVELRFFEELSYEEIAERMQLPLGTVKAKLFRARFMLQKIMQVIKL